jgi:hypothetical protein
VRILAESDEFIVSALEIKKFRDPSVTPIVVPFRA